MSFCRFDEHLSGVEIRCADRVAYDSGADQWRGEQCGPRGDVDDADAYQRAVTDPRPKALYTVGADAKTMRLVGRWSPRCLLDALMARHEKQDISNDLVHDTQCGAGKLTAERGVGEQA